MERATVDVPAVDVPAVDAPAVDTPVVDTPAADAPAAGGELVVVVAGGGAAGTIAAIALARHPSALPRRIVVVEPAERLGEGAAYGTDAPFHLLNVRAAGMTALPDEPGHFAAWCAEAGITDDPAAFVPRRVYGLYLRATLAAAVAASGGRVRLEHRRGRVTGVAAADDRLAVSIDGDGTALAADHLLLATGNRVARPAWAPDDPRLIADPWRPGALGGIGPEDPVTIVGSGLTAIDVVLSLAEHGHRGPVVLVSSHGLLPAVHARGVLPGRPPSIAPGDPGSDRVRSLVRAMRVAAREADDWRQVVDGMRPVTVPLWRGLDHGERRRALRRLDRRWDTHRHRMAPEIADRLDALRAAGRLSIRRGRVTTIRPAPHALLVTIAHGGERATTSAGAVVLCTGPSPDPRVDPLLATLIADGTARRHPLGIGLDVEPDGVLRRADGRPWPAVRALGSLRKGAEWEATAVPELRLHAREAAAALLEGG